MANQQLETTYTPINGQEARKILKNNICNKIDQISGMKMGLAFHKLVLEYEMKAKAYPADCPVPEAEFSFVMNAPGLEKQSKLLEHFDKIEILENLRETHLKAIQQIDKILEVARPLYSIKAELRAGDSPDELRIAEGLPVPMIQTSKMGKKTEVLVNAGMKE